MDGLPSGAKARVAIVGLYSHRYAAIGESHGLSVIAGALRASLGSRLEALTLVDMVAYGSESCDPVLDDLAATKPNVLAIGVQYGTYSVLRREYRKLRAVAAPEALVVFGGALATYEGSRLLDDIDAAGIVVEGEGDETFSLLVAAWLQKRDYAAIPNCRFRDADGEHVTARQLADLSQSPLPYRQHARTIAANGAQLFVESSRACSWAACTFCLRGLTDVAGRPREFRRFPIDRTIADIRQLGRHDVTAFTFADEDFLGGSLDDTDVFADELRDRLRELPVQCRFDISATVHSVYRRSDTAPDAERRSRLLRKLAEAGLNKVFLGVESASPSQLRRYAKGHSPEDVAGAVERIRELGVRVELGFIMFDPLCQLSEVAENVRFLQHNHMEQYVSALTNELRVQTSSRYLHLLERYERRHGRRLYRREFDHDTLTHECDYAHDDVRAVVKQMRLWNERTRPLVYPLKNLTRYGVSGAMGAAAPAVRRAVGSYRAAAAEALRLMADGLSQAGETLIRRAHASLAESFLTAVDSPNRQASHPVVQRAAAQARSVLDDERAFQRGQLTT
jgi:radical SAM superfamily enzyme YgiQ (UPF0313 family)